MTSVSVSGVRIEVRCVTWCLNLLPGVVEEASGMFAKLTSAYRYAEKVIVRKETLRSHYRDLDFEYGDEVNPDPQLAGAMAETML